MDFLWSLRCVQKLQEIILLCNFRSAAGYLENGLDTTLLTKTTGEGSEWRNLSQQNHSRTSRGEDFSILGKKQDFWPHSLQVSEVSLGDRAIFIGIMKVDGLRHSEKSLLLFVHRSSLAQTTETVRSSAETAQKWVGGTSSTARTGVMNQPPETEPRPVVLFCICLPKYWNLHFGMNQQQSGGTSFQCPLLHLTQVSVIFSSEYLLSISQLILRNLQHDPDASKS